MLYNGIGGDIMSNLQQFLDDNLDTITIDDKNSLSLENELGEAIMIRRKYLGMSQSDLAKASGIQQANISRIEKGHSNFTINQLKRIASALGASITIRLE